MAFFFFFKEAVIAGVSSKWYNPREENLTSAFWSRCKKVNKATELLPFEGLVWKTCWLASGNLDFRKVPTTLTWQKWPTEPKLEKQCGLCWTPAILLGQWNLGRCQAGLLCVQSPVLIPGTESLLSLSGFTSCHLLWREASTAYVAALEKDPEKFVPGSQTTLHVPFLFAGCA